MSEKWIYNEAEFNEQLAKIAAFSERGLNDVIREQASLFTRDANAFTPPFGNAPVKEGAIKKKKIGENAVARDIKRAFFPFDELRNARNPNIEIWKRMAKAARTKNVLVLELLLKKARIRVAGVLMAPEPDRHKMMRDKRGRVRKSLSYITLGRDAKLRRYIKQTQKNVGIGKSGWNLPLESLGNKPPGFALRHNGEGVFREVEGDKPMVTLGNAVPFVQDSAPRIEQHAWNNRMRNATKQAEALERHQRRKMRELGIKV